MLRRQPIAQDWRGSDRDAGARSAPVIQHVREKLVCRACEAITQPPAPSHPIARGRAGPKLLAHVLFSKYGLHLPLHRQSDVYQREGIDLDVSTLADWVGPARQP
jgi:transposase